MGLRTHQYADALRDEEPHGLEAWQSGVCSKSLLLETPFRIREACGHFRRPRRRNYSTVNFTLRQKKRELFIEVGYRLLSKFDLKRYVLHIVNLKHAFHILFSIGDCEELLFNQKILQKSALRAPQELRKYLQIAPEGHPDARSSPEAPPKQYMLLFSTL